MNCFKTLLLFFIHAQEVFAPELYIFNLNEILNFRKPFMIVYLLPQFSVCLQLKTHFLQKKKFLYYLFFFYKE
jgi:hypothetical protein